MSGVTSSHPPPLLSDTEPEPSSLRLNRTRWGLAVCGERTMRAVVASRQQGTGGMAPGLADHVNQIEEMCGSFLAILGQDAAASPHLCPPQVLLPFLQLLSSHAATLAKAVQCDSRLLDALMRHALTMKILFLTSPASLHEGQHHAALAAAAPLVVALLLPRCASISAAALTSPHGSCAVQLTASHILSSIAAVCTKLPLRLSLLVLGSGHMSTLVHRAVDEVRTLRQGRVGQLAFHRAFIVLAEYARLVTCLIQHLSKEGCEGAPPGSPALRNLLAGPLLQLLGSPLLDLLVMMPHVLVWDEDPVVTRCQYRLHCLTPLRPDDCETMPQVRLILVAIICCTFHFYMLCFS